jgi:hypothetical protein
MAVEKLIFVLFGLKALREFKDLTEGSFIFSLSSREKSTNDEDPT